MNTCMWWYNKIWIYLEESKLEEDTLDGTAQKPRRDSKDLIKQKLIELKEKALLEFESKKSGQKTAGSIIYMPRDDIVDKEL